jgi:GNAT superfamily N-acetyltransferase
MVVDVSDDPELRLRPARRGDGAALARLHREFAAYYVRLAPHDFRLPDEDGLAEFCESDLDAGEETLELVAELDGDVVGALWARLVPPLPDARYQINPAHAETQLHVDYLVAAEAHRRQGIATSLVAAAEEWGRGRGATVVACETYADSPLSVPFWHDRIGYRTRSVMLVKPLV